MHRLTLSTVLAPIASAAVAQSPQIDLECEVIAATIDGVQTAEITTPNFAISITPTDAASDGSGFYELTYLNETFVASNLSSSGPLVWSVNPGNVSILTIPSADGIYVLHDYWAITAIPSTTQFLVCEVQ